MSTFAQRLFVISIALGIAGTAAKAGAATVPAKASIVLIHGAFADGSSWRTVIPLLEKRGYFVTAVQTPLTSLAEDVVVTKRMVEAQPGPVVLVGHSYGGAVITVAAAESPKVKALVYVAAFAPEVGEALGPLQKDYTPPPLAAALIPDSAGFLFVDRAKVHAVFAHDAPVEEARVIAATQKPIFAGSFTTPMPAAAWKSIPSWYLVATEDRAINPDLERFMARRIGAKTTEVKSSHVPFLTHPKVVAEVILEAARSVSN